MRLLLLGTGGTETGIGIEEEEEEEEGGIAIREGGTMMTTGEEEADRGIWTTTDRGIEIRRGGGRGARMTSEGRRLAGTSIRGGVSSVCAKYGHLHLHICTRVMEMHHVRFSRGFAFADRATLEELLSLWPRQDGSPRLASMDWLNPVCHRPVYNEATWDLDRCFQETALTLLPNVVLAVIGGTEFPALWRRYRRGERERLPKEGKAAYAVKLVRPLSRLCIWISHPCASRRAQVEAGRSLSPGADRFSMGENRLC